MNLFSADDCKTIFSSRGNIYVYMCALVYTTLLQYTYLIHHSLPWTSQKKYRCLVYRHKCVSILLIKYQKIKIKFGYRTLGRKKEGLRE